MATSNLIWMGAAYLAVPAILVVLAIAAISAFIRATSKPKPDEVAALERSPGERFVDYRVANALIRDAQPNFVFDMIFEKIGGDLIAQVATNSLTWVGKMTGGLWVGGRVFLTNERIVFEPNTLNRALTDGLTVIVLSLKDVTAIEHRGADARIIDIKAARGTLSLRCGRAKAFMATAQNAWMQQR